MTAEIAIPLGSLIAMIGCIIGLAGWLDKRDCRIGDDREWRGRVDAKLDVACGIRGDVEALQQDVRGLGERVAKCEASASSAHHRLDSMERDG